MTPRSLRSALRARGPTGRRLRRSVVAERGLVQMTTELLQSSLFPDPSFDLWYFERRAQQKNFRRIAGVDEVGRGPLAGPVVAAAVVLPYRIDLPEVRDSKLLSPVGLSWDERGNASEPLSLRENPVERNQFSYTSRTGAPPTRRRSQCRRQEPG